ncbi:hypothetical protein GCM10010219_09620 [Streptomyces netropsis]|nr:hypothetical protein GCM10010219_09620 [Streptomyces netropsis]
MSGRAGVVSGVRAARPSGEGEVVHARDAEHGVVDSLAFEAAVAEESPGLQTGEDVLDAGADTKRSSSSPAT